MEFTREKTQLELTDSQVDRLLRRKIIFGHRSVGDNILQGIRDWMADDSRLCFRLIHCADPAAVPSPALVDTHIGENGNPASKDSAMAAILGKVSGREPAVVLYKYCYVDIDAQTDIRRLFEEYDRNMNKLKRTHPAVQFVHVTVPLTTVEPDGKAWVKSLLGRCTERDRNRSRHDFNERMRQTYAGRDPIFDLAEAESTFLSGTRSFFRHKGREISSLVPEFTSDGGHLNAIGRKAVAKRLLLTLGHL